LFSRLTLVALLLCAAVSRADAVPLFAQRYHLPCTACHSVMPELNQFGENFRSHGYHLPVPKHGTTVFALRYQNDAEQLPAPGTQRYQSGVIILGAQEVGRVEAFMHYNLGADGGPGALYLAYLANYDEKNDRLYRGGLFELPLSHSPGQRLGGLTSFGYEAVRVGLNTLTLSAPRWGLQVEQGLGPLRLGLTGALSEFQGSAYGGAPVPASETSRAASPELGIFPNLTIAPGVHLEGQALFGERAITPIGTGTFKDAYNRLGVTGDVRFKSWQLLLQQYWGYDANADGFGDQLGSSGGYARLAYFITPHAYLAVRYDAAANPLATRDIVEDASVMVFNRIRLIVEHRRYIPHGADTTGAAVTIGFPWPLGVK